MRYTKVPSRSVIPSIPFPAAKELARHKDIAITLKHYTDVRLYDLHAALASVQPVQTEPQQAIATGTGPSVDPRPALQLARNECKPEQAEPITGKVTPDGVSPAEPRLGDVSGDVS